MPRLTSTQHNNAIMKLPAGATQQAVAGYFERKEEGRSVLFNDALNTFYLRLYGVGHMVKDHSDNERGNPLPPHGLLFPISRQDNTYHGLCYTSRGALAGTRNRRLWRLQTDHIGTTPLKVTCQGQVLTEYPPPLKIDTSGCVIFEIEPPQQQPQRPISMNYTEFSDHKVHFRLRVARISPRRPVRRNV